LERGGESLYRLRGHIETWVRQIREKEYVCDTFLALSEIVRVLGRTWVVPKGVPSFVRRGEGR
jgi:hypothetical protein